jgi:hypothetical protein
MVEFDREFFKNDSVLGKLYEIVKQSHKVASHTQRVLIKNKHIKDFCEEARHYMMLPGEKPLYIHYDVSSWYKEPDGVSIRIDSIGCYDSFMEYEAARLKGIHSTKDSDGGNLN